MNPPRPTALLLLCLMATNGLAATYTFDQPDFDRWAYPFNFTPGTRGAAPTFGAFGSPAFDNRDGQLLIGFDSSSLALPTPGEGQTLRVTGAVVTVNHIDGELLYDPTYDGYQSYLDESDPSYQPDNDPGRPVVLAGVGLRNGFTSLTFGAGSETAYGEASPFGLPGPPPGLAGQRNAFAADATGVDISNNVRDGFDFTPFAVGQATSGVAPGEAVQQATPSVSPGETFAFAIDVENESIQQYLLDGLAGGLFFSVTSLHSAAEQAGGTNPNFFTRDNLDQAAAPPTLTLTVEAVPLPATLPGDFNGDELVDIADFTVWRDHLGTEHDLLGNGDERGDSLGVVDLADYLLWRDHFGESMPPAAAVAPEPMGLALVAGVLVFACGRRRFSAAKC